MARIKIDLPERFTFTTKIPIRITDINYGGHVGNDTILSILQEARYQFFNHLGYTELNIGGVGTIMSDVGIEYKKEIFYGDEITVSLAVGDFSKVSFDLFYKIEKRTIDDKIIPVVIAKTSIVCYDYNQKKIAMIPYETEKKLKGL